MAKMTFGLELETVGLTGEEIGAAIEGIDDLTFGGHFGYHGSRVLGLRHARMDGSEIVWVTERDGSLYCARTGKTAEAITPILHGREGLAHAARVMKAISRAGGKVNSTCGTHLTTGVRDVSARFRRMGANAQARVAMIIVEIYDYFWNAFCSLVSPSRRASSFAYRPMESIGFTNSFGQASKATQASKLAYFNNNEDYYTRRKNAVNLTKFATDGVIEFRMHNGTLNGHKITTWALLHHQILSFALNSTSFEDFRNFAPNLDGLMAMINVGSDLKRDLQARQLEVGMDLTRNQSYTTAHLNFIHGRDA